MKIIKFFAFLLFVFIQPNMLEAQGPCANNNALPCQYTPNWSWLDANSGNWQAQIGANIVPMGSPFTSNTNTNDMIKVVDGWDYLPQQGWVLFAKDFGCIGGQAVTNATPYFILYNKYKSVIRVFLYLGNTNSFNRASVILKWSSVNGPLQNNSLFTNVNDYSKANENYPIVNNIEKNVNYLNQLPNTGGWVVTEYVVNFDPNTVNSQGNFQRISFDFNVANYTGITMSGDFAFVTESATPKSPDLPTINQGNNNLLDYVVDAKNFLGKAPKRSEIQAGLTQISTSVNNINEQFCTKFTTKLYNANQGLQSGKLKDFLLGFADVAEGIGGGLGIAATVLEFFMGKSNTDAAASNEYYIQPTVSNGNINLTGTIVTESNPLSISVQLPGTSHKFGNGQINCTDLPVYDCPLGVISLQEAPNIEVRTLTVPEKAGYYSCSIDFYPNPAAGCNNTPTVVHNQTVIGGFPNNSNFYRRSTTCAVSFPNKILKSYKVVGDVKLALNDAAGVTIESAQAALFFEIKDNAGLPALDLLQSTYPTPASCCDPLSLLPSTCIFVQQSQPPSPQSIQNTNWNNQNNFVQTLPYTNYTKNLLNQGVLNLAHYDNAGFHKFQTPFIDIDKFKNTAITIEDAVNVYLKLLITMKPINPNHDQTPIVYVATYELPANKFSSAAGSTPFPMTCAQKIETDNTVIGQANTGTYYYNGIVTGNAITMAQNAHVNIYPAATFVGFEAYSLIKLTPEFKGTAQTSGSEFRAYLAPNAGGCAVGVNALQVQNHFLSCTTSALDRVGVFQENKGVNEDANTEKAVLNSDNLKMYVAPNPNSGSFKLIFNRSVNEGSVRITNKIGQVVYSTQLKGEVGVFDIKIDEILSKGVYYISWNNDKFVLNQKFIIE